MTARGDISTEIHRLISAGATRVTLTLSAEAAEAAEELAKDLRWACKTTDRDYRAEKIEGSA